MFREKLHYTTSLALKHLISRFNANNDTMYCITSRAQLYHNTMAAQLRFPFCKPCEPSWGHSFALWFESSWTNIKFLKNTYMVIHSGCWGLGYISGQIQKCRAQCTILRFTLYPDTKWKLVGIWKRFMLILKLGAGWRIFKALEQGIFKRLFQNCWREYVYGLVYPPF